MIAMGGAGSVHAFNWQEKFGIKRIVCPLGAGVTSAVGLLVAPCRTDLVRTYISPLREIDWNKGALF